MLDVTVIDLSYKAKMAMQHDSQKHTLRLPIVLNTRYITRTVLMVHQIASLYIEVLYILYQTIVVMHVVF